MNREQLAIQAKVLREAADASPIPTYAGMLRARAQEVDARVRACVTADLDGIAVDLTVVAALDVGVPVYWAGVGPARVLRVANGGTGLFIEPDDDVPRWVNPLMGSSPVAVIMGPAA